jgi:Tfp pilus assembly protein PilN
MIKVNLLREHTPRVRKITVKPTVSRLGLFLLAILILAVGGVGFWWYSLSQEITVLTNDRDRLRIENARLQQLKKQINEYEKMKQLRQSRIEVIEKLKEFQTGPVLLLNHVIHSIPANANLWLTAMDQKGDRVQIVGFAQRSEAIPDFMSSLAASGYFESVDLELIEEQKDAAKFSLLCVSTQKKISTE